MPAFRVDEFLTNVHHVTGSRLPVGALSPAILEPATKVPIAAYCDFEDANCISDDHLREIARRSALVRSLVRIWGEGKDIATTADMAQSNLNKVILPSFGSTEQSWRMTFRRYGRGGKSGLDPQVRAMNASEASILPLT
jgi:hypothetical protein